MFLRHRPVRYAAAPPCVAGLPPSAGRRSVLPAADRAGCAAVPTAVRCGTGLIQRRGKHVDGRRSFAAVPCARRGLTYCIQRLMYALYLLFKILPSAAQRVLCTQLTGAFRYGVQRSAGTRGHDGRIKPAFFQPRFPARGHLLQRGVRGFVLADGFGMILSGCRAANGAFFQHAPCFGSAPPQLLLSAVFFYPAVNARHGVGRAVQPCQTVKPACRFKVLLQIVCAVRPAVCSSSCSRPQCRGRHPLCGKRSSAACGSSVEGS